MPGVGPQMAVQYFAGAGKTLSFESCSGPDRGNCVGYLREVFIIWEVILRVKR